VHGSDDGALIIVCHVGTDRKTEDGAGQGVADGKGTGTEAEGTVGRLEVRGSRIVDLGGDARFGESGPKVIATGLSHDEEVPGRCRR
jgi:hypothetical protein